MNIWWIIGIACALAIAAVGGILLVFSENSGKKHTKGDDARLIYDQSIKREIERIFDSNFREEVKNKGRLQFESVMRENAMFLQQDLRMTVSELNDYVKSEVTKKLEEEFSKYEQAIGDAKQTAIDYIQRTNGTLKDYQEALDERVKKEISDSKQQQLKRFEENMTKIVSHYVQTAIGDSISLDSQLDSILADLEANKQAIIEDITNGS
ncbi:MAG TPA: hypothetical protein VMR18_03245 [Candidatus Saccharimonadales bacterium]|nr:hypothetical protein [Candidatus Saccharimonadales bacterium]